MSAVAATACGSADEVAGGPQGPSVTRHRASAVPTARSREGAPNLRFVGLQMAIIGPEQPDPGFQVRVRLDRRLPRDADGAFADIRLAGASPDAPPVPFGKRARHCYAAVIGNDFDAPGLRDVKPGSRVEISVRVHGSATLRRTVKLRRRADADVSRMHCG